MESFEDIRQKEFAYLMGEIAMLGRRLERLVEAGFLERADDRYRCAPKGAAAARTMGTLKAFLRLGPGG